MYKDFYRLNSEPFSTHPATDTFFISSTHREAWYYLLFGIDTQEPFIVLTGEYGMGKTLLCLQLLKMSREKGRLRVEYIPTTNEGYGGILRRMATTLGIAPLPESEEILQDMVYDRFRAEDGQRRFYLIIDDAHELDTTTLTKLKYLSTFSYNEFFPMVMIFVAHPSFLQELKTPALSSLNQRMKRRYHLSRFTCDDTKNYIYYRLLKSGATGVPSFSDQAIQIIFQYSGGIPRLINNLCDTCLLIGASRRISSISPQIVEEAKGLVEGSLALHEDKPVKGGIPSHEPSGRRYSSKPLSKDAVPRADLASNRMFIEDDEPEAVPAVKRLYPSKMKKIVLILILTALVTALAVLLTDILPTQRISVPFLSSPAERQTKEAPARPEEAAVTIPAARDEQRPAERVGATDTATHDEPSTEKGAKEDPSPTGAPSAKAPAHASVPPARAKSMPPLPAMYR